MGLWQQQAPIVTTRLNGIRINQAILGQCIPICGGQVRIPMKLLWYGAFTSNVAQPPGGSGLLKGGTQYVYSASIIGALCMGGVNGIDPNLLTVWDSTGKFELKSQSETYTITGGTPTYQVSQFALFNSDQGVGYGSAYSVTVNDFGSPGSTTYAGTQQIPLVKVPSSPAAGQYSINPTTGTYSFNAADAGKETVITYTFYRYSDFAVQNTIVPLVTPFTVTVDNQPYFNFDAGVTYYPSGVALTKVGGTPTVGEYNPDGGIYHFAAADAGQGITITYAYQDQNIDNNAPSTLNMTLFPGAQGQSPSSYMTTNYPGLALGYTQVAYILSSNLYLGYTPEIPAYSFELVTLYPFGAGITDCCPSDFITGILSDSTFGIGFSSAYIDTSLQGIARDFWVANNFFISPILDSQRPCASVIGEYCEAGQVGNFWSEGVMKFIPYGTTTAVANGVQYTPPTQPLYSFGDGDYQTDGAEAPIKVSRSAWQDAWNKVQIQWSVRSNDYNSDICQEQDDAAIQRYGLRLEPPKNFEFIRILPAAQFAANMRVNRFVSIRNTYTFRVNDSFWWLDPMDIIEVTDPDLGLNATACRITKMTYDPQKGISITAEDFPWASGNPSLYTKQSVIASSILGQGQLAPGDTNLLVLELTDTLGHYHGNVLYLYAGGNSPNWGGAVIYKAQSTDTFVITHVVASAGTVTVTGTNNATNPVIATDVVTFFNTGTVLDGQTVTVATASGSGFTAPYVGTIGSTAATGFASAMTEFQVLQTIYTPARMGVLTANLAAYSSANPDTTNTLAVEMNQPSATLGSVSATAAALGFPATLCAVISQAGGTHHGHYGATVPVAEFLSYETATLTSAGTPPNGPEYNLTTLYRGLQQSTGAAHVTGDIFVRMDEASITYEYPEPLVGAYLFIAACSFNSYGNQQQALPDVPIYAVPLQGVGPGTVDLDVGFLLSGTGVVPPNFSGTISYTLTGTTITVTWTTLVIYRADGTTTSVPNGSVVISGLTNGVKYYIYLYYDETLEAVAGVTGGTGTSSLGAIAWTTQSNVAIQGQNLSGEVPLSAGALNGGITTNSGGGGGIGGGPSGCPRHSMLVETPQGAVSIGSLIVGDRIIGPTGWMKVTKITPMESEELVRVTFSNGEQIDSSSTHVWHVFAKDGWYYIPAQDLATGMIIEARNKSALTIRSIEVIPGPDTVVGLEIEPEDASLPNTRLHYIGKERVCVVTRNYIPGK